MPSRQVPGSFYALPQSPQLFKQLLMVGGIDRYYQIARCLRDEDLRADRQYEFTQLDAEASFVTQDEVLDVHRRGRARRRRGGDGRAARRRSRGSPGTRPWTASASTSPTCASAWSWSSSPPVFAATEFKAFASAGAIKGLRVAGRGGGLRAQQARRPHRPGQGARRQGPGVDAGRRRTARSTARSPSSCPTTSRRRWSAALGAEPGDLLLLVADEWMTACEVLGQLRNDLGRPPVHEGPYRYVWVVDFPMFVGRDRRGHARSRRHHPFTRPHPDDIDKLESDPMSVRSKAYDLVLNGWELGSGSIRIHEPDLQQRIFDLLGIADGGGAAPLRLLPHPVPLRRPAPRRLRLRHRPPRRRSSPARRTSARSSPSPSPSPASTP